MNIQNLPEQVAQFIGGAKTTDTSGRSGASTYRIDGERVSYLKIADTGRLSAEAEMTSFFARYRLSAEVLLYISSDRDYLITSDIGGYSGITPEALSDPKRLCEVYGTSLRRLHDSSFPDCRRISSCMSIAVPDDITPNTEYTACVDIYTLDQAKELLTYKSRLKTDVMLHGDYCLPNILLDSNGLRGFIDLGEAGMGDRHFDLFWGVWSLCYNLGTNDFREYFLDCYGRDAVDMDMLRLCGLLSSFS